MAKQNASIQPASRKPKKVRNNTFVQINYTTNITVHQPAPVNQANSKGKGWQMVLDTIQQLIKLAAFLGTIGGY